MEDGIVCSQAEGYGEGLPGTVSRILDDSGLKFTPSSKVLLKPNLLRPADPESAVTTHPAIVESAGNYFLDRGCEVLLADSPGGPYNKRFLRMCYKKSGMLDLGERTDIQLNYDTGSKIMTSHEGEKVRGFEIINPVHEADIIINLPKLKTHVLTYLTGAVKNCFGFIPGLTKSGFHARFPEKKDFGSMLVDLEQTRKTDFTIMDAVVGMEGDGPAAGTPIKVGALISGSNNHAVDDVALQLAGLDPQACPTWSAGLDRGLFRKGHEVTGSLPGPFSFKPPSTSTGLMGAVMGLVPKTLHNAFLKYPSPDKTCIGCGKCVEICAPKAMKLDGGQAHVDLGKCIRCYCCHEICPVHAIELRETGILRLLKR